MLVIEPTLNNSLHVQLVSARYGNEVDVRINRGPRLLPANRLPLGAKAVGLGPKSCHGAKTCPTPSQLRYPMAEYRFK